jgi:predicted nucleic acid-binding Zn ribbon protein
MKCDAVRNRLLDLPDLAEVPAELLVHADGCEHCARFVEKARALAADLAALPAPSAESAKLAFLDSLEAAGPVIKTVPAAHATGSTSLRDLLRRVPLRPVGTIAAAALVGVGLWSALPGPKPPQAKADPPRHELLNKVVALNTELAGLAAPKDRVTKLAGLAADLRAETQSLAKAAQRDEMLSLANMVETVVRKGIVNQAEKMTMFNTTAAERQAALKTAMAELSRTASDVTALVPTASQQVQPLLQRIAKTARDGEARLLQLANGEA